MDNKTFITKKEIITHLVGLPKAPVKQEATAYAPANIALIKYWGKRNSELNLPVTNSLSLSLPLGTHTLIKQAPTDVCFLNGKQCAPDDAFTKRLFAFCDLFRAPNTPLHIETKNEIPTAAGFASSSSGFAALVLAFNDFYGWNLEPKALSILARIGSGSASRSLFTGFVEWQAGTQEDGLDSYSAPLDASWPDLHLGLVMISDKQKPIDSRRAMQNTVETSALYHSWPEKVAHDLRLARKAIYDQDFLSLGQVAESNALAMHATMMAAVPPVLYWHPDSVATMHKVWKLRQEGLNVYFTMDAGPNIKLLYLKQDAIALQKAITFTASEL
ncbi:MAG: diphosphomevalonate decarboxylase [Chlamydiales bacterium]|nr:diphosphomevalonate decarboxylase [Chlamydiales bacterium]